MPCSKQQVCRSEYTFAYSCLFTIRAGVKSLDDASDALDASGDGDVGEPHRVSGLVLIVTIAYDNTYCAAAPPCSPGDEASSRCCPFQYTISARRVSQTEFKVEETISNPLAEYAHFCVILYRFIVTLSACTPTAL